MGLEGSCWFDRWRDWVDLKTRKGFWIGEDPDGDGEWVAAAETRGMDGTS